eukprot:NODE_512_length_772_cov_662.637209_g503_i0.p1 GENE.NODE_512_length_772_cov_662.637209_g503_i0~~NODE_512_length_772_cov_662.637209_g503_i0.p1  ORF type:complete len:171 (-),score=47.59 NODE_512_length_772_cov_662.637209_g503_i0:168-680(-)
MPVNMRERLEKASKEVRTGGKGTVRRKYKAQHRTTAADDKKLQASLKKLGVNSIGDIDEVNIFMNNGTVVHFTRPKVQASIPTNTYVVSGHSETKKMQEMLPQLMPQLGQENLEQLKQIAAGLGEVKPAEKKPTTDEEIPDSEAFDNVEKKEEKADDEEIPDSGAFDNVE